eukprot:scaffold338148_cov18-Prasinocladus_malaysianus.AAC.2
MEIKFTDNKNMGSLASIFRFMHHHSYITQKFWSADAEVYFMDACLTVGTEPYEKWAAYYRKQPRHTKIESGQRLPLFVRRLRGDASSLPEGRLRL